MIKRILGFINLSSDYIKRKLSGFIVTVFNNITHLLGENFWLDISLWNGSKNLWDLFLLLLVCDRVEGYLYHFIHKLLEYDKFRGVIITSLYSWSKQYKKITSYIINNKY